jgi:hypothetical protein
LPLEDPLARGRTRKIEATRRRERSLGDVVEPPATVENGEASLVQLVGRVADARDYARGQPPAQEPARFEQGNAPRRSRHGKRAADPVFFRVSNLGSCTG